MSFHKQIKRNTETLFTRFKELNMNKYCGSVLVFSIFLGHSFCHEHGEKFVELAGIVLEKGKPIELEESHVEEVLIKGLGGTLYSDSLSELHDVSTIKISSNQLKNIEPGAICSTPSLRKFQIDFHTSHEFPILKGETFEHCENLEDFSLIGSYDKIPKIIEYDCLQNLAHLKHLSLNYVNLDHITKDYFKGLKSLNTLTINRCSLNDIDSDAFEDLDNLEKLDLSYTNLNHLPKNLFRRTPKLTTLYLNDCNITDLTWDEFEGLDSLKELHLFSNHITHFDAEKVAKYMPRLVKLSIHLNPVECTTKEHFVNELKEKLNHDIQVSYKFDPGYYDSCEETI